MECFFKPAGIAVIGATRTAGKGGRILIDNLKRGYGGAVYPVNPRYDEIAGLTCYAAVADLPDPVDLAILFVGARHVPAAVSACGARGIRGVMVLSAGFAETGPEGKALQDETAAAAAEYGVRIWGPNCLGMVDIPNRRFFSTVTPALWETDLTPGRSALIVQSGMLAGAFLIDLISHGVMGFGRACSIGNKMDVDESDLLEYFIHDPETRVIGLYLESIRDGARFLSLCRRSGKPVVVLKGGKSPEGARAAESHTASMAGEQAVLAGVLAQAGVVEASDFYELTDLCRVLESADPEFPSTGNRIGVVTYSGGAGIVSADFLKGAGLALATLSAPSLSILATVFPEWMPPANPVDLWPGILVNGTHRAYNETVRALCADPEVDGLFVHCFVGGFDLEPDLPEMARLADAAGKPLFCWISGEQSAVLAFQKTARELGVMAFREINRAIRCMGVRMRCRETAPVPDPAAEPAAVAIRLPEPQQNLLSRYTGALDEQESKQILKAAGIPVVEEISAADPDAAVAAAADLGFPVVMKGLAPGRVHKTEAGLVQLNIRDAEAVRRTFDLLQQRMAGQGRILVQRQVSGGVELILGLVRDPQFGPCVMVGLGGIFTELLRDRAFAAAPLTHGEALSLIGRLSHQPLLDGFRGAPPVDREALADSIRRLGALACRYPRIRSVDINPMLHSGEGLCAVDAVIVT